MQQKHIIGALIALLVIAGGYYLFGDQEPAPIEGIENPDEKEIRSITEEFGTKIQNINLAASDEKIIAAVKEHYGPYVADVLIEGWEMNPGFAPGRATPLSPRPSYVEILLIEDGDDGSYDVQALVVEVSESNDVVNSYQIALKFRNQEDRWVITGLSKAL